MCCHHAEARAAVWAKSVAIDAFWTYLPSTPPYSACCAGVSGRIGVDRWGKTDESACAPRLTRPSVTCSSMNEPVMPPPVRSSAPFCIITSTRASPVPTDDQNAAAPRAAAIAGAA